MAPALPFDSEVNFEELTLAAPAGVAEGKWWMEGCERWPLALLAALAAEFPGGQPRAIAFRERNDSNEGERRAEAAGN